MTTRSQTLTTASPLPPPLCSPFLDQPLRNREQAMRDIERTRALSRAIAFIGLDDEG